MVRTGVLMRCVAVLVAALTWSLGLSADSGAASHARAQARMVAEVVRDFRQTAHLTGVDAMSEALTEAMRTVPRHAFVNPRDQAAAYANRPLPIGHGQTISQPFIVALMTELAAVGPRRRVLEIGTGSGYQAAILAALGAEVYSIEIIARLAERATRVLAEQGYDAVQVRIGDGNLGWPEAAPFDAIVVTAGGELPAALLDQLAPHGRLVIPLDTPQGHQDLTLLEKQPDGSVSRRSILPVRFVPLVDGD